METEVSQVVESSTPEQVVTVTPETVVVLPVEEVVVPKTFTQEELDAAIGKRLAREQRKWEREHQPPVMTEGTDVPLADQFKTVEEYAEALVSKKLEQREQQKQHAEISEAYHGREEEARDKYDDFDQVAYNPKLTITSVMAEAIRFSDVGPDVVYFLGVNPKEAERISRLAPILQAKEIGRIEAKLATTPPTKRVSSAPEPIVPVTARSSGAASYDTTDPRAIKSMSTSEWIAADRARQMKKQQLAQQH